MKNNLLFKMLSSMPVIFLALYFIPFLGVCLILFRIFVHDYKKRISTCVILFLFGIIILIPQVIYSVLDMINFDKNSILYLNDIINNGVYNSFIDYSKFIISLGVVLLIISFIMKNIIEKLSSLIRNYIIKTELQDRKISKENDMEIKLKQERAKETNFIKCPNCGADNIISEKIGTCKYCRRKIVNDKCRV